MMNTLISAVAAPLPSFARAAAFAVLAIAAVGAAQLWQHRSAAAPVDAAITPIDAGLPLAPAPMAVDMWRV
jgi:hypothetical protein